MIKFQYVGNSVESFKGEESIDLKETCGIPDTYILSILDSESTEFTEEWFTSKVIGNINHLISGDKSHYTFQYHTVMDIGTIYDSSKDIFYFFASV